MEDNCGGGQGLNWAVEPRGEREITGIRVRLIISMNIMMIIKYNKNL
jgi:hypothetical protein